VEFRILGRLELVVSAEISTLPAGHRIRPALADHPCHAGQDSGL